MLDDKNESYESLDNELQSILGMDNMEREIDSVKEQTKYLSTRDKSEQSSLLSITFL